jgi:hypothetical protein
VYSSVVDKPNDLSSSVAILAIKHCPLHPYGCTKMSSSNRRSKDLAVVAAFDEDSNPGLANVLSVVPVYTRKEE